MKYAICCTLNCLHKVFIVKSITNIVRWTYVVEDLIGKKIFWHFSCKRTSKDKPKEFGIKKITKKDGDIW